MSTEKPKRLPLTLQVVRNLYALSGNRCAAEGCQQPLVKADGTLVGEIAHIRAAMPDGPRFDASMTNEARRDQSNLMIFCRNHHKIVDSRESEWTVEALTQLKDKHERIYSSALDHLRSQVSDITEGQTYTLPTNLGRLGEGWVNLSDEELEQSISDLEDLAQRLGRLAPGPRSLLAVMVNAAGPPAWGRGLVDLAIRVAELESIVSRPHELRDNYIILREKGFADVEPEAEGGALFEIFCPGTLRDLGWHFFQELNEIGDSDLTRRVINDLDFRALSSEADPN